MSSCKKSVLVTKMELHVLAFMKMTVSTVSDYVIIVIVGSDVGCYSVLLL